MSAEEPWWATGIRGWLAMHQAVMDAYGEKAGSYKILLEQELKLYGPTHLYKFFKRWSDMMKAEKK